MDNLQVDVKKIDVSSGKRATCLVALARIFTTVCIICAVVLSLYMSVMRFAHLGNGLQYDELYSAITAFPQLSFSFIWKNMLLQDINLPLFNILLFVWNRIFPFSYVWLHLFSALLGLLAVIMAWFLAPKYWQPLKKYIFVSLMACSFILVAYGHIVRTYSLSILLSTIFSLLGLRFIYDFSQGKEPSRRLWLAFYIAGFLGAYSHFFCTAEFFITALIVFLYACYYKIGRKWAFWGTAVVFALWSLWLAHVLIFMKAVASSGATLWWYKTPFAKATYDILIFLFGPRFLFSAILYTTILAVVSLIFTYKKQLLKRADFILPLMQILLLLGVVALVALFKVNLWMDRYFLPAMPAFILLFTECLDHLQKRHLVLLILWPALLWSWVSFYWQLEHLHWQEYTGLQALFSHLAKDEQVDKILVDMTKTGYPEAALPYMFGLYIPKDKNLELIPLTPENVSLSWQTNPKTYIFLPLCSQIHFMQMSMETRTEEDGEPMVFGRDACIFTVHPAGVSNL